MHTACEHNFAADAAAGQGKTQDEPLALFLSPPFANKHARRAATSQAVTPALQISASSSVRTVKNSNTHFKHTETRFYCRWFRTGLRL